MKISEKISEIFDNDSRDDKKHKGNRNMPNRNREIAIITYFFVAVFMVLLIYIGYFTQAESRGIVNNSYNKRQDILAERVNRGCIFASDNSLLAYSHIDENGNETRIYPYANMFAHIVGYSSHGRLGLEYSDNFSLITSNLPFKQKFSNELKGHKSDADSIITTLNPAVQSAAYSAIGDRAGAVFVMDIKTGAILSVVSKPDFDPNQIDTVWDMVKNDSDNTLFLNRATQGLYPPGSTFKIVTALEYIKEHNGNIDDYTFDCTGKFEKDSSIINCIHGNSHGTVDFSESFAQSCNSSFANITSDLNRASFAATCDKLLFGEELPIPLLYSKSSVALNSTSDTDELLQTGIGQGRTLISPAHMTLITSAIANNGVLMEPYIISKTINANSSVINSYRPTSYGRIFSLEEASLLQKLMEKVVTDGTGTRAMGDNYTVAGKTGSAEYSSDKSKSHAWFTGYAPADNPRIALTVIVEGGGSGGLVAAPIAKSIFDAYFNQ